MHSKAPPFAPSSIGHWGGVLRGIVFDELRQLLDQAVIEL